jgi:hypothetical protein
MKSWGIFSRSWSSLASLAVACLMIFAFASSGQAAVINFTGAPYNTWTSGPHSYTTSLGGTDMTVSAWETYGRYGYKEKDLGYKEESRDGATAAGIGVWGGAAGGEIDPGEMLYFEFAGGVDLTSFTTNFQYKEYTNTPEHKQYYEWGQYKIFDGVSWSDWTYFGQDDSTQTYPNPFTPGAVTVSFGSSGTQAWKLAIKASGCKDHDFTINQITTGGGGGGAATPEPASMLLLASALGGFGFFRMRRKGSQA